MGNRAVITTKEKKLGIYLHWNGGRDSVEAFLQYCKLKRFRYDMGMARLTQVIANFFGGTNSVDIDILSNLDCDNYDNGLYIIDNFEIVGREFQQGFEQKSHDLQELLLDIDSKQPLREQLGEDFFNAVETATSDLKVGDVIFFHNYDSCYEKLEIVGLGSDMVVNGTKTKGIPYVNKYGKAEPKENINNYLKEKTYRRL